MAGSKKPTLKDIAREVGLNVATVSRALDPAKRHTVTPETAARILAVAARINYVRNEAGYALRTKRSQIIGVVVSDIANPIFPPIVLGIEEALAARDYLVIQVNSEATSARHAAALSKLKGRVDGLIVGSLVRNDKTLGALAEEGVNLVTVNRRSEDDRVPSVTHDETEGIRLVLEHLKALGHKRVVNVACPQNVSTGLARYEAFERFREALGLDTAAELVVRANKMNEAEGERCAAHALDRLKGFTAIVASNDRLALGVLGLLKQRGVRCPKELSVTGFNDMPMVDRLDPPLTTVRVQQGELGRRAAAMLMHSIDRRQPPNEQHVVLPVTLVVRQSTAAPPRTPWNGNSRRRK